jgi:hypothetical protein
MKNNTLKEQLIEAYQELRLARFNADCNCERYLKQASEYLQQYEQATKAWQDWKETEIKKREQMEKLEYELEELGVFTYDI